MDPGYPRWVFSYVGVHSSSLTYLACYYPAAQHQVTCKRFRRHGSNKHQQQPSTIHSPTSPTVHSRRQLSDISWVLWISSLEEPFMTQGTCLPSMSTALAGVHYTDLFITGPRLLVCGYTTNENLRPRDRVINSMPSPYCGFHGPWYTGGGSSGPRKSPFPILTANIK